MALESRRIMEGAAFAVYSLVEDGKDRAQKFLEDLERRRLGLHVALLGSLHRIAEHGAPRNTLVFRHEGAGVFAIKEGQARLYCFFCGKGRLCLTNGDIKKQGRADPVVLAVARRLKSEWERQRQEKQR
ncbi:MAG: hypothetical protein NTW86_05260 [Candidatus Sumerlaeota bacterium]|nr:hypothetical protein [Candidatus Sumerlaeota bacterium]